MLSDSNAELNVTVCAAGPKNGWQWHKILLRDDLILSLFMAENELCRKKLPCFGIVHGTLDNRSLQAEAHSDKQPCCIPAARNHCPRVNVREEV